MCENVYICRFCGFLSASRIVRPDSASRIGVPFWRPELGGSASRMSYLLRCRLHVSPCVHTVYTRVHACIRVYFVGGYPRPDLAYEQTESILRGPDRRS